MPADRFSTERWRISVKLLIVDDGHYIVEYLKHLLDWGKFGIDRIQTTTNSVEAKRILEQSPVDILITDIRMPEISGIHLLEHVKALNLATKVIFLSGYSEFEYAQQAVRLGAFDYLLKPVDKEDVEKAIKKVTCEIGKSQQEGAPSLDKIDGFRYLLSLLSAHGPLNLECNFDETSFAHIPLRYFRISPATEGMKTRIRDFLEGWHTFVWTTPSLLAGVVPESTADRLRAALPSIGLSELFQFRDIHKVQHTFYQFFYEEEVTSDDFHVMQEGMEFSKLESREWECARNKMVKRYPQLTGRKYRILYLLKAAHYLYLSIEKNRTNEVLDWLFNQLHDPDEAYKSILCTISRLAREDELTYQDTVHSVQTYINDHLDEALSLEDLGRIVHLHPAYLSKLYKQQTGENLSSYIMLKRLERASGLLTASHLHVGDISRMVGYKKPQYFIKLFKEHYGVTPQQYRKRKAKIGGMQPLRK